MEQGYIFIANNVFPTLFAISSEEHQRGLMFEEWPPPVMSFVYTRPQINKFWMHNTVSPLDILFCHNGKITQICYGEPHSTTMLGGDEFSNLVIEVPHGTVATAEIKLGHSVGLVSPTFRELRKIIVAKNRGFV